MTFLKTERIPKQFYGEVTKKYVDTGAPMETSELIENFFDDEMAVKAIYASEELANWLKENHMPRLEFGGGEYGITAFMLMNVPKNMISKIVMESGKQLGPTRAKRLVDQATQIMETEPGY
jgi:hypothetical protein